MKKLMKITVVLALNFLALSFSINNHYSDSTELKASRAPASASLTAKKSWSFKYKDLAQKPFQIKKEASNYEEAYKSASRECFQQLTGGQYPGEEKGLDIIDICANPKI
jgi:hypothetical protein